MTFRHGSLTAQDRPNAEGAPVSGRLVGPPRAPGRDKPDQVLVFGGFGCGMFHCRTSGEMASAGQRGAGDGQWARKMSEIGSAGLSVLGGAR